MTWFYQYLDWPSLPLDFEHQICDYQKQAKNLWIDFQTKNDGKYTGSYGLYELPDIFVEKILAHIGLDSSWQVRLQAIFPPLLPPHVDFNRLYSFNYQLTNDHAVTSWHAQDKTVIESVQFNSRQWIKINTSILHSVSKFSTLRLGLTIYQRI